MPEFRSAVARPFSFKDTPTYTGGATTQAVSVVIPVVDLQGSSLSYCLDSVRNQNHVDQSKVEIVLVIARNISKKICDISNIVGVAGEYKARVFKADLKYKFYPLCGALNSGAKVSSHGLLLFLDSSTVLDPETIVRCASAPSSFSTVWSVNMPESFDLSRVPRHVSGFRAKLRAFNQTGGSISSAGYRWCTCVPRSKFFSIRGYDEVYDGGFGAEDNDLVDRLIKSGCEYQNLSREIGLLCVSRTDVLQSTPSNVGRYTNVRTVKRNPNEWGALPLIEVDRPKPANKRRRHTKAELAKVEKVKDAGSRAKYPSFDLILPISEPWMLEYLKVCCRTLIHQNYPSKLCKITIVYYYEGRPKIQQELADLCCRIQGNLICRTWSDEVFTISIPYNIAARCTCRDALAFLDCDTLFPSNLLKVAAKYIRAGKAVCVPVGRSSLGPGNPIVSNIERAVVWPDKGLEYRHTGIGNIIVPRSVVMKMHGFDEEYRGWGAIDTDFCIRVNKDVGVKMLHNEVPLAIHLKHRPAKTFDTKYTKQNRDRLARVGGLVRNRKWWGEERS